MAHIRAGVIDWKGRPARPKCEGRLPPRGRIVGSVDWETMRRFVSVENVRVHPSYRSSPVVLWKLIDHLDPRYAATPIIVWEFANPKVERLIAALNRRPRRWAAARAH